MKCSLLTLSTFIDGELAAQRRAEVDAHLIGCTRCTAGAATLREEKGRVGQLARVTVDPGSAQLMLEQVGITLDSVVDRSPVIPPPPSLPADVRRPWQGGESSRALPWTPRRPDPAPLGGDHMAMPAPPAPPVGPEVQPDLPLDGMRFAPPSWDKVVEDDVAPAAAVADLGVPAPDTEWIETDEQWLNAGAAPDSWEEDLAPAAQPTPPDVKAFDRPAAQPDQLPAAAPAPPPSPTMPMHAPPTHLAAASGPAALWTRVRDAVTVRLALARGGDAIDDSLQIISGAPSPRGAEVPPVAQHSLRDALDHVAPPPTSAPELPAEVELNGFAGHARPGPSIEPTPPVIEVPEPVLDRRAPQVTDPDDISDRAEPAGWNAFAASSYADADVLMDEAPRPARPRPIGRHTRAVAREQVPLSTRLARGMAALAAAARVGTATAVARVRRGVAGLSRTGPDSRLLAGIAGIGLIFVIALLIGHGSARPLVPTAARPTTAPSAAQTHPSAPAKTSAAASAAVPPPPAQTFGAGGSGFQVIRLRYGAQAGYMRVVFDMGAVSGTATGTPKATVSYSNPTTVLVTFTGAVPAGSTGTPTPGKVISSVTLVSSAGGKTVYRFGLTRAATATAFYLTSPTRFVLDLH